MSFCASAGNKNRRAQSGDAVLRGHKVRDTRYQSLRINSEAQEVNAVMNENDSR